MCTNFQTKRTTLTFWAQICPKMDFGVGILKSKSGFGISTSNLQYVPIFSQNGQLLIFWPKFEEIAQLRAIFWFKYCWGRWRELGGDSNELSGGGWSWVELGGDEWRWMEVGARFSNTRIFTQFQQKQHSQTPTVAPFRDAYAPTSRKYVPTEPKARSLQ